MDQNQTSVWLVPAIVAAFLVVFPAFWCFVCLLLSWVGGWSRMAVLYGAPENKSMQGKTFTWRRGRVGFVNYKGVLTIETDKTGMRLSVMPLFRAGHPPLFIPWEAITDRAPTSFPFFGNMMKFNVGSPLIATVVLPMEVFEDAPSA